MDKNVVDRQRLLERFLRYVQVETTADARSQTYPSSPGQLVLGKLLADELMAMGLKDARLDENGLVWATIPATVSNVVPVILFNAHIDTSPDASGKGVRPRVVEYQGDSISLEHDAQKITAEHCPALNELVGKTLVVTDGRTLLGGDDKAGVAAIMEMTQSLIENPSIPHGDIQILFTCDEEIGAGTQRIDMEQIKAKCAYTLDGGGIGDIDEETFSADLATIRFHGHNIHPSIGKGRMVNALRAAAQYIEKLPKEHLSPESTEGRQGFLHPYDLRGGVGEAELLILLRDFDNEKLSDYKSLLEEVAMDVRLEMPGVQIEVETKAQYRNMADGLRKLPQAVEFAFQAYQKLGIEPRRTIVRGGTDGSQLTALGLPTPNLSVGQHNIHSVLEFVCLDQMYIAVQHLVELVQLWGKTELAELEYGS